MAHYSSNFEQEQADQWAVLRHEVEDETVKRNDERAGAARSDWDQRDTEDDSPTAQNPYDYEMIEQTPNHVDIVVAGIGGAGMNAVNRMINTRVRGVRFVALNTDIQVLSRSEASDRICLGQQLHKRPGSGWKRSSRRTGSHRKHGRYSQHPRRCRPGLHRRWYGRRHRNGWRARCRLDRKKTWELPLALSPFHSRLKAQAPQRISGRRPERLER